MFSIVALDNKLTISISKQGGNQPMPRSPISVHPKNLKIKVPEANTQACDIQSSRKFQ